MSYFFIFGTILIGFSFLLKDIKVDGQTYMPKYEISTNENFESEIFFNDIDGYMAYSQVTIDTLRSAEHTIQIAMYSIQYPFIVDILEQKQKEGVQVEIIIPKSKTAQHTLVFGLTDLFYKEVGKSASDDESAGDLMHHKFILIDTEYETRTLLIGSSNLTFLQEKYDPSFLLKTNDIHVINIFKEEFDLLKKNVHGIKKIFNKTYNPFAFNGLYSNGVMQIWFSPGYLKNSIKYKMLNMINDAKESIKIIGWRINDTDIAKALIKKAQQGVKVDLITDDYYAWDPNSIFLDLYAFKKNTNLENLNLITDSHTHVLFAKKIIGTEENLKDNFNSFMHHHTLIIDDKELLTGTNNWGVNGFYLNDESIIVTDITDIVNPYVFYFDYLKTKLQGQNNNLEISLLEENKISLNNVSRDAEKIILYIEKSNPDLTGEICLEIEKEQFSNIYKIPENCITKTTKIMIVDSKYNLLQSSYAK